MLSIPAAKHSTEFTIEAVPKSLKIYNLDVYLNTCSALIIFVYFSNVVPVRNFSVDITELIGLTLQTFRAIHFIEFFPFFHSV